MNLLITWILEGTTKLIHLLIAELEYELRICNIISQRNKDEKRKILARHFDKEISKPLS